MKVSESIDKVSEKIDMYEKLYRNKDYTLERLLDNLLAVYGARQICFDRGDIDAYSENCIKMTVIKKTIIERFSQEVM
jgi:hypothetical protein